MPLNSDADYADHLEEQMPPLEAWGTEAVMARHSPRRFCAQDDDVVVWRIVSGADDMTVAFDPPLLGVGLAHYFATQGEWVETETTLDYHAHGYFNNPSDPAHPEAPFLAYQLMTGSGYNACTTMDKDGDPMMVLSTPTDQFLTGYVFATDTVVGHIWDEIIVVRPQGSQVALQCLGLLDDGLFSQVGGSSWEVGRFFIDDIFPESDSCTDGLHVLSASDPIGLSVVGVGWQKSYGYPGGTALSEINPHPVIQ
jgi:hypothetical protein